MCELINKLQPWNKKCWDDLMVLIEFPFPNNVDRRNVVNFLVGPLNIVWWRWGGIPVWAVEGILKLYTCKPLFRTTLCKISAIAARKTQISNVYALLLYSRLNGVQTLHFIFITQSVQIGPIGIHRAYSAGVKKYMQYVVHNVPVHNRI